MKNLFPKGGALVILLLLALAFIVNSCRKDISVSQAGQEQDPKVAAAKSWYEDAYPVSITGQKLQTNSTEAPDLSQKVKPDWQHTANYSRFDEDVIEMPIDPESKYAATLQRTDGSHAYTKTYTRSSFLLLKGDKGYEAYLMTIVGDSSYIKNNPAKLANNSYRQRDSDFTGMVLYFTPKGRYVSGYRYNNGQLVVPQTGEKQSNCVIANSQHTNAVIRPNTLHCLDWFMVTSQNGIIINVEYLYRTCSDDGACISGGGGGGSGAPPPPTPCPGGGSPGTPPVVQPTATPGGHVKVNSIPTGGFPPPSGGSGCNVQPLPEDPVTDEDPCAKMKREQQKFGNSFNNQRNAAIQGKPGLNEYGSDLRLTSPTSSIFVNTPITTNNTVDSWAPTFTWNSTDGYTIGSAHRHPGGSAPSPDDVFSLMDNLTNPLLTSAGASSISAYKKNAYITVTTSTATFVVTVKNWGALAGLYNNFNNNRKAFDDNYQDIATDNLSTEYALSKIFGDTISIYKAPIGTTNFVIVGVDQNGAVIIVPCPNN